MNTTYHAPVLLDEVLGFLITDKTKKYVDGTLGGGGHAEGICEALEGDGGLIAFDADEDAIAIASTRLSPFQNRVIFVRSNFRNLKTEIAARAIGSIHGLLLDLGVSSYQLEEGSKGFSFRADERIDMRMDQRQSKSGWDVVNSYEQERLADVIYQYGEEKNSRRIARRIAERRPIESTGQLAQVIESAVGKKFLVKTLARVFQAIRIEVNDELGSLKQVLEDSLDILSPGGRLAVISYHSLEDRIVKNFFKKKAMTTIPSGHKLLPDAKRIPELLVLTKSPVLATDAEIGKNPRARSAKLRVAERLAN